MPKAILPIVQPSTGEILKATSPLSDLSNARRELLMKLKVIEQQVKEIDEILAPAVATAAENGQKEFAGYWQIVRGSARFNADLFKIKAAPEVIKEYSDVKAWMKQIEDNPEFKKDGAPYLKFPRLS